MTSSESDSSRAIGAGGTGSTADNSQIGLAGVRVLITQSAERTEALKKLLKSRHAELHSVSLIRFVRPSDPAPLRDALRTIGAYDLLIFTSVNAVEFVLSVASELGIGDAALAGRRIAAVGPATAAALQSQDINPTVVPRSHDSAGILAALARQPRGKVLLPQSDIAGDELAGGLRELGFSTDVVCAYRTLPNGANAMHAAALVRNRQIDAMVLTSPSNLSALLAHIAPEDVKIPVITLGKRTSDACRKVIIPSTAAGSAEPGAVIAALVQALTVAGYPTMVA